MEKNKIVYGFENVHIAFEGSSPGTYEETIHIPGAVNFSTTPASNKVNFPADNIRYFTLESNNGYTGTLEMALIPDEVLEKMLGWVIDSNGMLVEVANAKPKKFALMGEVKGDLRDRRFVYYDVMALRPNEEVETQDETIDPKTMSLPVEITPITVDGKKIVKGTLELNATNGPIYNSFFTQVVLPDAEPVSVDKTSLQAAIALAGKLPTSGWDDGWDELELALGEAETIEAKANAMQKEVNAADAALRQAILELVPTA